jgi:HK97 family phage prohead protease
MPNKMEYRTINAELRVAESPANRIEGRAVVYNEVVDLGYFREKVAPGAFNRAINEKQDIRFLVNHNPDNLLGRTASGTLAIAQDDRGVTFACDMPDTQLGRDTYTLIKRGDLSQCSFGFIVNKESVAYGDDGSATRTIEDLDCFDLSTVAFPAYPTTSVTARSLEEVAATYKRSAQDGLDGSADDDQNGECDCACPGCTDHMEQNSADMNALETAKAKVRQLRVELSL